MIPAIFLIAVLFFIIGGLGIIHILRKNPDQKKNLLTKYFVYIFIVFSVLSLFAFTEWKLYFGILISLATASEIIYAWFRSERKKIILLSAAVLSASLILLSFLTGIYTFESLYLLKIYSIVFTFDGFSQISGQLFGRKKISPKTSPGKTLEGLIGGVLSSVTLGIFLFAKENGIATALAISSGIVFLSFCGDLLASFYKRKCGIKDYSNFIPGHGGITDRFDSFMFCVAGVFLFSQFLLSMN